MLVFNAVTLLLSIYVIFMTVIVWRYSRRYMAGERCYNRYFIALSILAVSVLGVIVANAFILLSLSWGVMVLSLSYLMGIYAGIPEARRMRTYTLKILGLGWFILTVMLAGIDHFYAVSSITELSLVSLSHAEATLLAVVIAIVAMIQCAQYPFHRWLTNSMTTPTPVSAMMHAGIVNAGCIVILKFSFLISVGEVAQWLLMIVALMSIAIATYGGWTQHTVKGGLCCSTMAQMAFMLLQCALGLYLIALMHLILHGFYKAYQFLNSGHLQVSKATAMPMRSVWKWVVALILSYIWVDLFSVISGFSFAHLSNHTPLLLILWVVVAYWHVVGLSLLAQRNIGAGLGVLLGVVLALVCYAVVYRLLSWMMPIDVVRDYCLMNVICVASLMVIAVYPMTRYFKRNLVLYVWLTNQLRLSPIKGGK